MFSLPGAPACDPSHQLSSQRPCPRLLSRARAQRAVPLRARIVDDLCDFHKVDGGLHPVKGGHPFSKFLGSGGAPAAVSIPVVASAALITQTNARYSQCRTVDDGRPPNDPVSRARPREHVMFVIMALSMARVKAPKLGTALWRPRRAVIELTARQ